MALQLDQIDVTLFKDMWQEIVQFLPKLAVAVIVFILGWLFIKLLTFFIKKALSISKVDNLADKLNEIDMFRNVEIKPTVVIVKTVKWILILILLIVLSDILGMQVLKEAVISLIGYLPRLFSALAIFIVGVLIANLVKNATISLFKSFNFGGSKAMGNILFFAITIVVAITALNQAGIDTSMITNNLTLILGAFLLAFTIAFGLGSKEIVQRLLFGFYSRKNLHIGQRIRIGEKEGTIEAIDSIYLTLKTKDGKYIFPIKEVNDQVVQVIDKE